jgi:hypothetical protein
VERLRDLLVDVAARGTTITYDELRADLAFDGDLVPVLRALSVEEDDAGRGLLTAVVVRTDTGLPGEGWFRLAAERDRGAGERVEVWRRERAHLQTCHRQPHRA